LETNIGTLTLTGFNISGTYMVMFVDFEGIGDP
jgi:hypothetical protein